ncbi:hypothetical protein Scep_010590 [Stephania cephalantha]|uniref:Uncharacterized protein n=1 Tax=Stephania cephalantha TaxID=152367 RepID=A0AAP0JW25_9MAGN
MDLGSCVISESISTNHKRFERPEEMGIEEDNIRKYTTPPIELRSAPKEGERVVTAGMRERRHRRRQAWVGERRCHGVPPPRTEKEGWL